MVLWIEGAKTAMMKGEMRAYKSTKRIKGRRIYHNIRDIERQRSRGYYNRGERFG